MAIIGVTCGSAAAGLGESTSLAYSSFFHRNVISTWSSGTGACGVLGAVSYAGLTHAGLSPHSTVLSMIFIPALMCISFWIVLEHANDNKCCTRQQYSEVDESSPILSPNQE